MFLRKFRKQKGGSNRCNNFNLKEGKNLQRDLTINGWIFVGCLSVFRLFLNLKDSRSDHIDFGEH